MSKELPRDPRRKKYFKGVTAKSNIIKWKTELRDVEFVKLKLDGDGVELFLDEDTKFYLCALGAYDQDTLAEYVLIEMHDGFTCKLRSNKACWEIWKEEFSKYLKFIAHEQCMFGKNTYIDYGHLHEKEFLNGPNTWMTQREDTYLHTLGYE